MTDAYTRVVGDTDSDIEDVLIADDSAVDISGFQEVSFHLEKPDGTVVTDTTAGNVTVEDSPNGRVKYAFAAGDLDTAGRYRYEWEVTFGDGGVLTFPSKEFGIIFAREDLD